ncbi:permease [Paenibacillus amylolyticus]|uniref:Permease n=1 Tax=Paenibacillus amylolyticus TaxID=1451 RepID=A0A117I1Q0_PAEAM|nr:permease [Paenibacillus amylolyticus]
MVDIQEAVIPAVAIPVGTMVLSLEVAIPADLTEVDLAVRVAQVGTEVLQAEDFTDIASFSGNRTH